MPLISLLKTASRNVVKQNLYKTLHSPALGSKTQHSGLKCWRISGHQAVHQSPVSPFTMRASLFVLQVFPFVLTGHDDEEVRGHNEGEGSDT